MSEKINENKERKDKGNDEDEELKDKLETEEEIGKGEKKGSGGKTEEETKKEDEEKKKREEEEMVKKLQEEIDKLTTADIVLQMMMSLSSLAYKKMGIPSGVNDKFKDKEQAKLAIDCFDALFKVISNEISAKEREDLQSSLSNLQLNFVKVFL